MYENTDNPNVETVLILATLQVNRRKDSMKQFGAHLPKGKFIVLGSSGELLPVSRNPAQLYNNDHTTTTTNLSQDSSPDEFYSAKTSLPDCDGSGKEINFELIGYRRWKM